MKWLTREKVKVDRVACPWLIDKLIDPEAEFIFVPVERVMEVAATQNAIPYDVKFVEFGHQGKECSFDALQRRRLSTTRCTPTVSAPLHRASRTGCSAEITGVKHESQRSFRHHLLGVVDSVFDSPFLLRGPAA